MTSSLPSSSSSDHESSSNRQYDPPLKLKNNPDPAWSESTIRINAGEPHDPDGLNESSPLLSPTGVERDSIDENPAKQAEEDYFQSTKSVWYLFLLTISLGGLQVAWAVELSNGTPYLLSLGLSKSLMALVWVAGPLTGTLVQPYVGMLSDNCRISWGKRKPFMLGGAAATALSYMFLAWIREIVGGILGLFGADPASHGVKVTIIVIAVIWIYVLDVAVNTVQASIRAFIVDCAPSHQQEAANSMASRLVGIGNIIGYIAGGIDLPRYTWWFGSSQFKDLCAIASIFLCSTVILSTIIIRERNPQLDGRPATDRPGLITFFVKIFASIRRLPPQVAKVCIVQFAAWIGFFPMLFYTSSYIGEIYVEPFLEENPHMTAEELDDLYEKATRVGTFALLIFAITSLATNVLLPFFIDPTYDNSVISNTAGHIPGAHQNSVTNGKSILARLVIPGFTLRRAWLLSEFLFAGAMFCTVLVRSVEAATALIGIIGITWALALWAPWAIISAEISRRNIMYQARKQQMRSLVQGDQFDAANSSDGDLERDPSSKIDEDEPDQAGVILGIHNMAIASPQFIATLGSSIIFRMFQKPRGVPGDHSIAIVLACGGFFALVAAYFIHKINDEVPLPTAALYAAEEGDPITSRPSTSHSKTSVDQPRASLDRATEARNSSFGAGLEY
ncbi:major facilitator superfamily domain-containing protein [Hypoxylon trugodes]|uniref:major facilitator superfamily domain-containing protein n=1 Tax=Hypoxylon trugodes TaxID=326681 RepID=UPI00219B4500|nr:major facilitator superfamily domain-containing protein [Hypoxylon trugodes]KAI1393767.1 major facilitator superfamily domain-containing protein [Hypoxylon trugodes]